MKRSRRVVLTSMGSAAVGAIATRVAAARVVCGPGLTAVPGHHDQPCRATHGGFGRTLHHFHGHGPGHGQAHGHAGS